MLASPIWPFHTAFVPPKPSPLSPRSANIPSRVPSYGANGASVPAKSPSPAQPYSKRAHKPVPTLTSSEALSKQRRERFLREVQRKREDRRWSERCDYIFRSDFVNDKRKEDASKARAAASFEARFDEDDADFAMRIDREMAVPYGMMPRASRSQEELRMVEQLEDAELEELIGMMEAEAPSTAQPAHDGFADIDLDLDDDDWRDMMVVAPSRQSSTPQEGHDAMDTSG